MKKLKQATPPALRRVTVKEFLTPLNVQSIDPLPLVHTTESANVYDIVREQKIGAMPCSVFRGESLCYFFVGRPAYKIRDEASPDYWQLPLVFAIKFENELPCKRIFPFDSGAFANRLLPTHMLSFALNDFDLGQDRALIGKLVATYFGSNEQYFRRKPFGRSALEQRHVLEPKHMQVLALARLYDEHPTDKFDDRSSAIEVQTDQAVRLTRGSVLGVVAPDEYKRDKDLHRALKQLNCDLHFYPLYPIRTSNYYSVIYAAVEKILKLGPKK